MSRSARLVAITAGLISVLATMTAAQAAPVNQVDGVGLHGFDPVAYFTRHKPMKGNPNISAAYDGTTYEFASAKDRALFQADPQRYAPQYGGFCAYGVAEGAKVDIDPHAFLVKNGKLYLNFSEEVRDEFQKKADPLVTQADRKWPAVSQQDKVIH